MKKYLFLFGLVISTILLNSCVESSPTYTTNYYANFWVEFYTLDKTKWIPVEGVNYQWFQEFKLTKKTFQGYKNTGIMCFYKNQYGAWEALPSTRIFWTDKNVVYSDELWYSHDDEYIYFDYRNTIPDNPVTPGSDLEIKAVFYDASFIDNNFINKNIKTMD